MGTSGPGANVQRRSNRLARGLLSIGIGSGDRVVILCCDGHDEDRLVAREAVGKALADPVVLSPDLPASQLREHLIGLRPRLIVACSEGVGTWRRTHVACQVVGDEQGVTWWKLLEARNSPAPLPLPCIDLVS